MISPRIKSQSSARVRATVLSLEAPPRHVSRGKRPLSFEACEFRRVLSVAPATVLPAGEVPEAYFDMAAVRESQRIAAQRMNHSDLSHQSQAGETGAMVVPGYTPRLNHADRASSWIELAPMLYPRGEHANAVVDGKIYVFGGLDEHFDGPDQVERYDPRTNQWESLSTMPLPRHHFTAGASVYQHHVWIVGGKTGDDSSGVRRVDVYDTLTDTWRRGPDLPTEHWGGPSVIVGDKLHVLTGAVDIDITNQHHWVLDLRNPRAGWRSAAEVPFGRVHAGGVALHGKIYVVGGERNHSHRAGDTTNLQVYDAQTNSWSHAAPLPRGRSHMEWSTFAHGGFIYSVGGVDSSQTPRGQTEIFRYSPAIDTWELVAELPFPGVSVGAKIVGDMLYVFGGGDGDWFDGSLARTLALPLGAIETHDTDFNRDGQLDGSDVDLFCAAHASADAPLDFDLNGDRRVDFEDLRMLIFDVLSSRFGDSDLDGEFTTRDIIQVFQVGEFEDAVPQNSVWADGDWNCDGEFNTRDVVLALQYGMPT